MRHGRGCSCGRHRLDVDVLDAGSAPNRTDQWPAFLDGLRLAALLDPSSLRLRLRSAVDDAIRPATRPSQKGQEIVSVAGPNAWSSWPYG